MNETQENPQYMLLFRNTALEERLPKEEMVRAMQRLNQWLDRWSESGHITSGQPLAYEGRTISGGKAPAVADGPFAEAKESVAGYVLLRAADFDEATRIARDWPLLDYDATVEIRPVRSQCPSMIETGMRLYDSRG